MPKQKITQYVLEQLNMPSDLSSVKNAIPQLWCSIRVNQTNGFRLTDYGYACMIQSNIKSHKIAVDPSVKWTSQMLIWMDRYFDCPFFIQKNHIYLFGERTAVQLTLFSGDITKFVKGKLK